MNCIRADGSVVPYSCVQQVHHGIWQSWVLILRYFLLAVEEEEDEEAQEEAAEATVQVVDGSKCDDAPCAQPRHDTGMTCSGLWMRTVL